VTIIDIPYLAVKATVNSQPDDTWFTSLGFDMLADLADKSMFTTVKVDDYVWGYNSPFLEWINQSLPLPGGTLSYNIIILIFQRRGVF